MCDNTTLNINGDTCLIHMLSQTFILVHHELFFHIHFEFVFHLHFEFVFSCLAQRVSSSLSCVSFDRPGPQVWACPGLSTDGLAGRGRCPVSHFRRWAICASRSIAISVCVNPSIHQSINPSIHQSINPSIHQSINP